MSVSASATRIESDALVVFGATGDLAFKQIFPGLLALARRDALPAQVIGVAKPTWTDEQLRAHALDSVRQHGDDTGFEQLSSRLRYVAGDYADPQTFAALAKALAGAQHPLFCLAIPPSTFAMVAGGLAKVGLTAGARVAVEKPFGHDLASAQALEATLAAAFPPASIFRIDHFLGKEAVEHLVYFRFATAFLEPIWNRDHVERVEITMPERFGVTGRGAFYDEAGAIRDVLQNHLLRGRVAAGDRRARRSRRRGAARREGADPEGDPAARSGAGRARFSVFGEEARDRNSLRLRPGPDVAIALGTRVKRPGEDMTGEPAELVALEHRADEMQPYERLLGDAMRGDPRLFARAEAVFEQWGIVEPALGDRTPVHAYGQGTWGPAEAAQLVPTGDAWHDPIVAHPDDDRPT